ncbi:hypothetical protein PIB30_092083 [Stylosanthes scabra]|uniref:Ubiquitin-like protease family profile domain-containing protein n=1 Tax=Stylosanthes scabra TaxID=79078 RepID=A0ABU6WT40_9FABA|nr:hypothetical protein [Stylosanthes scabra]
MMIRDAVTQEMHEVTTILSEVLKVVSPSSKTKNHDSKLPDIAPSAELSDVPMVNKRGSRCKGTKRGRISQVKKELHYEEKLPPGRPWLYYSAYDPNMDGEDMPHCLDLAFRPTKGMKFFGPELAFAAYIFGNNLKLEEELVTNAHCDGTRKTLLTIMPGKPIIGDVLVLVCLMLTYGPFGIKTSKLGSQWYLPPTFSIFLPIHLLGHWFLIKVDLVYETVSYFDSLKGCILKSDRESANDRVLEFLEQILSQGFHNPRNKMSLVFSKYKFLEPNVPQQDPKSCDCGIWVSKWMNLSCYFGTNHK